MNEDVDVRGWGQLGWVGLAAACAVDLAAPGVAAGPAGYLPLAVSLLVFGMAHGAVDHHVARRLGRRQRTPAFCAAYVAGATAVGALWFFVPMVALVLFLAISTFHWGQGEVWFARATGRPTFGARWRLVAFVAARGSLPVLLPVLVHPGAAGSALASLREVLVTGGAVAVPSGAVRTAGLLLVVATTLAAIAGARADRAPLRDIGELAGLAVAVCLLPPVLAVGTYFLCWHAPRHVVRLIVADPAQRALLREDRSLRAVVAFHREAAPLCAVALAGCFGLLIVAGTGGVDGAVTASLAIIAGLTWPHTLVVYRMDVAQGFTR